MGSMVRLLVGSLLASMCAVVRPPEPGPVAPTMAQDGGVTARGSAGAASSVRGGGALTPAPEEVAGLASVDACPDEPEAVNGFQDADGCPDVVPQELAAILGVVEGVTFDLDKDVIRLATSRAALEHIVEVLQRHPDVRLEVSVHSEDSDAPSYGRCLTCRRAQSIRAYLVSRGVASERLTARGYGANKPIDTDRTPSGRKRNRRIELSLQR
jgi:outer membrane protein OmpA-like peptidoglycan-associated protein